LEQVDWKSEIPDHEFCFRACRPATGGVRKITVIFSSAKIDIVVVPHRMMSVAAFFLRMGIYGRIGRLNSALNEMATCLHAGYRFLKGKEVWGRFYDKVSALAGVRLNNVEVRDMADAFVCDAVWAFEKLIDGEYIAAQHVLHSKLSDTNLRLWRELRLRKNLPLPSFGLGRRVEVIAPTSERELLSIDANLNSVELQVTVCKALGSLRALMGELDSDWSIPRPMEGYLDRFTKN
jgi:hypothetical protein